MLRSHGIAIAESRELDLFADMLEREGASVLRCPLVAIHDSPDQAAVEAWLARFVAGGAADIVLYTGEGVRRLVGFADRAGLRPTFIAALARTRKITRGPKPLKALREIGLTADLTAPEPTTAGLIAALSPFDLTGRTVAVQLYGQEPNAALFDYLRNKGAAIDPVAPYIYASAADDERVSALIGAMAKGEIAALAFTSSAQVARVFDVAEHSGAADQLRSGLARTKIAAVGPVVAEELRRRGCEPNAVPASAYALKPLVKAIAAMVGE